jgi:hypothetical protein
MRLRRKILLVVGLIGLCFITFEMHCLQSQWQRNVILKRRMEDVKVLVALFSRASIDGQVGIDSPTNNAVMNRLLEVEKVKLHAPIPRDPQKPCYSYVIGERKDEPLLVVEENDNVADSKSIVKGYADGTVGMQLKKRERLLPAPK